MNTDMVPQRKVVKYKHLLFGVIILVSGIFIGFSCGIYMIKTHFDLFRPPPRRMSENVTNQIIKDYPTLAPEKEELNQLIYDKFTEFHSLNEEISYRILRLQHDIAVEISDHLPKKEDRDTFMESFPKYFPGHQKRLPRARRFEKRQRCEPDDCQIESWYRDHRMEDREDMHDRNFKRIFEINNESD